MQHPRLEAALARAARDLGAADDVTVRLERPRETAHGDLAANLAMVLAQQLGRKPRELAGELVDRLDLQALQIESAEIAGPGFINFRVSRDFLFDGLRHVCRAGRDYGRGDWGAGSRVNVEFVSANPTGPLHVGHGRGAAVGDTIARLLEFTGHDVCREFYVNDAGSQIDKLVDSISARHRQLEGESAAIPEGGYHGEYIVDLARELASDLADELAADASPEGRARVRRRAIERVIEEQRRTLEALRVQFDEFRSETELRESSSIEETVEQLTERGLIYEREGARWLRTTDFEDDKDRVLVKSDGSYTYFLPDIAYHHDKAKRGFDTAIDIWGADHHGYVPRMTAAMRALGLEKEFFEAVIVQLVRIERGGEEVKFSKRAGEFVTLRDLVDEVGADVTRYFFLERGPQQQMVFDLDLAKERSEKNPVYKVQYAHARIRSVYRRGDIDPEGIDFDADLSPLVETSAHEMIKTILGFPEVVEAAARSREPHRITAYLENLANELNSWYHAGTRDASLRVLGQEEAVTNARLVVVRASETVLRNGLELLGIEAPESM
ncbi:MAG: arginine--tRNA ligase [Gemmatimonadetes bacterium]|uniref:Arginine--tRNA ligase n=1 Tax=Candidatus Kutchimonas denitrificans TaxID=3056748 RepID=A0AAE4ZAK3_9BACT|nr:arginine--tRNA ligase [Gemmatimonadota bacterium]NIR75687.1 arginine--tRNA ligase [Candidatus Kutchimonas denitrificans]NIS00300.1 arginine--tRNA ligase [Gemmatimonadota bacterium]NIT65959.1 arginine--tRNA ligase [Gemmatimonadota bacterium]NIU53663.1 arginine--tRNA ligase [Gemmatimonadota bacterium]